MTMKNTLIYKHKTAFGTIFLKSRKNGFNPESLYLEIYHKSTQKRNLQFLGLSFTGNPVQDNKIKQDAIGQCINYVFSEKKTIEASFTDFCNEQILNIEKLQSRKAPYKALNKLHEYSRSNPVTFYQVNESLLVGFRNWLLTKGVNEKLGTPYSRNTADLYFTILMGL